MLNNHARRQFLKSVGLSGLLLSTACQKWLQPKKTSAQVVVVGGGFAGATTAKYIKLLDSSIRVILVEPKAQYITCPASNWLFADMLDMAQLTVDYQVLRKNYGIEVIAESVLNIDAEQKKLHLSNQHTLHFDRLILSPGIAFRWDSLPGYSEAISADIPHAWRAGKQTLLLKQQLTAMADGDVAMIYVPAEPYRCPPGPYERASLMAYGLKQHKPKSKLIILDAKTSFSKQKLFEAGWAKHFGYGSANSLLEWVSLADNPLIHLDAKNRTLRTDFGDQFRAQCLNFIPPQQAASIAVQAGLTDASGWCPVEPVSSRSRLQERIHIIGDAANYAPLPKSAFAANSEAKTCALAVVSLLNDQAPPEAHWLNTCYSLITPEHGISVAGVYKTDVEQKISLVKGAGGVSPVTDANTPVLEAAYAKSVYQNLVQDSFS